MARLVLPLTVSVALLLSPVVYANPASPPADIENAKYQYLGAVNANAVMVRSGPSSNDYPTMRLDKGAQITVVGMKFDWLKIAPPEGSFSYVSKLYVERYGDGSAGKVTKDNLNVWCGSSITTVKSALQCRLPLAAEVRILGEADEYYKIKPPADAFVWIHQNLVSPLKNLTPVIPDHATVVANPTTNPGIADAGPTTGPATMPTAAAVPTTGPSQEAIAAAEAEFDRLEALYRENDPKPIEDQASGEMLGGYEKLAAGDALPASMRRIVESRIPTLKIRAESKEKLLAVRAEREAAAAKLKSLQAERTELTQKVQEIENSLFTAAGTLQASSLQPGGATLYRLTDPANGRTVIYVRSSDTKFALMMGKFVGVKGDVVTESALNLRVVNASAIAPLEPAKINNGVSAQIIPPSLLSKPTQARTDFAP